MGKLRNKILFEGVILIFCFASIFACNKTEKVKKDISTSVAKTIDTLAIVDAEGRTSIFNGENLDGWHVFNHDGENGKWKALDGTLFFDSNADGASGDIVTNEEYENFELSLDWKISACGNSGLFWGVKEDGVIKRTFHTGPEMQVLDNSCHPDAKIITHRAGDLYDLISCSEETVNPAGEWNAVRLISNKGKTQFYLNGTNVVNFEMHTPAWDKMVAESKFDEYKQFGKYKKGRIALQDHGNDVWFRNIKIKEL